MYALRERRQHVTQEDFEFAVAKVSSASNGSNVVLTLTPQSPGPEEELRDKYVCQQAPYLNLPCLCRRNSFVVRIYIIFYVRLLCSACTSEKARTSNPFLGKSRGNDGACCDGFGLSLHPTHPVTFFRFFAIFFIFTSRNWNRSNFTTVYF
jgi:hypothetical protein